MKKLQPILLITALFFTFTSCEILRDVANDTITKNVSCIPPASDTYKISYDIVAEKTFESDREEVAKRETRRLRCLTTAQIKKMALLFDFESTRLDYAKFAYHHCADQNNYYQMNDIFTFESSKRELETLTRS